MITQYMEKTAVEELYRAISIFCKHNPIIDMTKVDNAVKYDPISKMLSVDDEAFYHVGNCVQKGEVPAGDYMLVAQCHYCQNKDGSVQEQRKIVELTDKNIPTDIKESLKQKILSMAETRHCAACNKSDDKRVDFYYIRDKHAAYDDIYQVGSSCFVNFNASLRYIALLDLIKVKMTPGCKEINDDYIYREAEYISVIDFICRLNTYYLTKGIKKIDRTGQVLNDDCYKTATAMDNYARQSVNPDAITAVGSEVFAEYIYPSGQDLNYRTRYYTQFKSARETLIQELTSIIAFYDTVGEGYKDDNKMLALYDYGKLLLQVLTDSITNVLDFNKSVDDIFVASSKLPAQYKKYHKLCRLYDEHRYLCIKTNLQYAISQVDIVLQEMGANITLQDIFEKATNNPSDTVIFRNEFLGVRISLLDNSCDRIGSISLDCTEHRQGHIHGSFGLGRANLVGDFSRSEITDLLRLLSISSVADEVRVLAMNKFVAKMDYETDSAVITVSYIADVAKLEKFKVKLESEELGLCLFAYTPDVVNAIINHTLTKEHFCTNGVYYGYFSNVRIDMLNEHERILFEKAVGMLFNDTVRE